VKKKKKKKGKRSQNALKLSKIPYRRFLNITTESMWLNECYSKQELNLLFRTPRNIGSRKQLAKIHIYLPTFIGRISNRQRHEK
jgi:hypothetical protein